jgi:outer membrane lipoprotein-sorting protein
MRAPLIAFCVAGMLAAAQEPKKPDLTAQQIIDKSIEASGGRAAMEKVTSSVAKGMIEGAQGLRATMEFYAKAPNKRLIVTVIETGGEIRQGFDGKVGWSQDPARGVVELTGAPLADLAREAVFNSALKWREVYPKAELTGREKIGVRDAYVVRLTPASGKPVTQYFDAETFLMLRQISTQDTPSGPMELTVDFSDYRDVGGGIKAPFRMRQKLPVGDILVTMIQVSNNVEIDDATFAMPARQ